MNIFVTGACGFIGSHLVEKLVKNNFNVKALTFYNNRNHYGWLENLDKKILKNVSIVTGDIRDQELMNKYTQKMDAVIHLAALISIPYSYISPQNYIDTNIIGTHNILQSSIKNKIDKVIITSTSEVYGTALKVPIDESHPLNAQSPYAASKWAVIGMTKTLAMELGKFRIRVNAVCPGTIKGDRMVRVIRDKAKFLKVSKKKVEKEFISMASMNSWIYEDDIGKMCSFLISKDGERISGQTIPVDGNATRLD